MTAQENLAWVIEAAWGNPTWDGSTLRPIDRTIAAAVVAFLTSDEAVDRAAALDYEWVNEEPWRDCPEPVRMDYRGRIRAAILAVLGVESLPGQSVLDAIHGAQDAVARGERAEVVVESSCECGDYPAPCNHDPAHVTPHVQESLPLDPEPWKDEFGIKHSMEMHGENGTPVWKCEWAPDPAYEQRREFYERGAE